MTVTYSLDVSNAGLASTFRLLCRWRGSIFKVVYKEGLIYTACWLIISLTYRLGLDADQRRHFEDVVIVCRNWYSMVPMTFILGFYVSVVYSRWQGFVVGLPWADSTFVLLAAHFQGATEKAVQYRRTIVRYTLAAQVLCLRAVSLQVKKRFPSMQHVVDSQLLKAPEAVTIETSEYKGNMHWLPMHWGISILTRARREGLIASDVLLDSLVRQLNLLRSMHGDLLLYDGIQIPLVYTQLVSLAVWIHFSFGLLANQWIDASHPLLKDSQPMLDLYVPIFTLMQFVCFVGWLRVAQNMLNPMGEGDDDLELNAILDQNLQKGFLLVDSLHNSHPPVVEDGFHGSEEVPSLPHTLASLPFASDGPHNSTAEVTIPSEKTKTVSKAASLASSIASTQHSRTSKGAIANLASSLRQKMSGTSAHENGSARSERRSLGGSRLSESEAGSQTLRLATLEEGNEAALSGEEADLFLESLHQRLKEDDEDQRDPSPNGPLRRHSPKALPP